MNVIHCDQCEKDMTNNGFIVSIENQPQYFEVGGLAFRGKFDLCSRECIARFIKSRAGK